MPPGSTHIIPQLILSKIAIGIPSEIPPGAPKIALRIPSKILPAVFPGISSAVYPAI